MPKSIKAYIDGYRRYDLYVDVVSIFETLFTSAGDMADTVRYFERYPTITAPDGNKARPDFTVLFNDGTGLAGEIASIGRNQEALDKACHQLQRYDALTELPANGHGVCASVNYVDVIFLTPTEDAVEVSRRILNDCLDNDDHWYAPSHSPLIASFVLSQNRDPSRYVIQPVPNPLNGTFREHNREPAVGRRLHETSMTPDMGYITPNKVERVFMNDPIDPLYLATHLWTKVFPESTVGTRLGKGVIAFTIDELTGELRSRYGRGSKRDVRDALEHLRQAKLADHAEKPDEWIVAWEQLRGRSGEHDTARRIANRIAKPPASGPITRARKAPDEPGPLRLFDP